MVLLRKLSIISILLLMLIAAPSMLLYAQDSGREATVAIITFPVNDQTVSGEVAITGSASHPSQFAYFNLEYNNPSDPNGIWLPIAENVSQQTTDGILGIWRTVDAGIPDNIYRIRLRVFLTDTEIEPVEFIVNNIQLTNTAPTPLPTSRPDAPTPTDALPPTAGPSPTNVVVQPPASTPRPTVETINQSPANTNNTISGDDAGTTSIDFGRIQSSFCIGSIVALVIFSFFAGYLALRRRFRPVARQIMWQIRSELDDDGF